MFCVHVDLVSIVLELDPDHEGRSAICGNIEIYKLELRSNVCKNDRLCTAHRGVCVFLEERNVMFIGNKVYISSVMSYFHFSRRLRS